MQIFHILWAIFMMMIPFLTKNKLILFAYLNIILITISTRKIFNTCMLRILEDKNSKMTNNFITKKLNWDYIFLILGIISNYKLFKDVSPTLKKK